jgi:hypothetical protein
MLSAFNCCVKLDIANLNPQQDYRIFDCCGFARNTHLGWYRSFKIQGAGSPITFDTTKNLDKPASPDQ